jgi:hypothetical protein
MLLRIDPKVILSCITRLNTLLSHSTDTKRGANGLRRSHGLFEVDDRRRNDFYLFPEVGGGPKAHRYRPFLTSAKFNGSTTLSHAAVLCPERDAVLCHLADLVYEYFGLDRMVVVLLQVVHEGAGHTLSPHHDRLDWSAVVSVTLSGKATFVLEKTSQLHVSNGDAWCLCDSGRHCFEYNTQHGYHKLKSSRTAVVLRFQCPPPY